MTPRILRQAVDESRSFAVPITATQDWDADVLYCRSQPYAQSHHVASNSAYEDPSRPGLELSPLDMASSRPCLCICKL